MTMLFDSSAMLAYLYQEAGAAVVAQKLDGHVMSAANFAEVVSKMADSGMAMAFIEQQLEGLASIIAPVERADAVRAGALRPLTRHLGLSLGDRLCLATAERLQLPVLTGDRSWLQLDLPIAIDVFR
jgi:ribonuclease VapC